jgi:hypothetical protein
VRGRPVALVNIPEVGVPNAGEVRVGEDILGDVFLTTAPVPVGFVVQAPVKTPVLVTGEFVTVKSEGKANPTEVTLLSQPVSKLTLEFLVKTCPVVPPGGRLDIVPPTKDSKSARRKGS